MMTQVLGFAVFSGAAGAAGATIWTSIAPQWRRIVRLAAGFPDGAPAQPVHSYAYHPLSQLVRAERRIAVRNWSASSRSPAMRMAGPLAGLRGAA